MCQNRRCSPLHRQTASSYADGSEEKKTWHSGSNHRLTDPQCSFRPMFAYAFTARLTVALSKTVKSDRICSTALVASTQRSPMQNADTNASCWRREVNIALWVTHEIVAKKRTNSGAAVCMNFSYFLVRDRLFALLSSGCEGQREREEKMRHILLRLASK